MSEGRAFARKREDPSEGMAASKLAATNAPLVAAKNLGKRAHHARRDLHVGHQLTIRDDACVESGSPQQRSHVRIMPGALSATHARCAASSTVRSYGETFRYEPGSPRPHQAIDGRALGSFTSAVCDPTERRARVATRRVPRSRR